MYGSLFMKLELIEQNEKLLVASLFKRATNLIPVHALVATLLVFSVWNTIDVEYLYHWTSLLICSLLLSLLAQYLFARKLSEQAPNIAKWERLQTYASLFMASPFAIAYCYLITLGHPDLLPTIAIIIAMHVSCLVLGSVNSKKAIFVGVIPIILPAIASLVSLSQPFATMHAISFTIYTAVLLYFSASVHRLLLSGHEMTAKYQSQLELTHQYEIMSEATSIQDPQTKFYNRRFFDLLINDEIRRAKRGGNTLSLMLIEIDSFNKYLKFYGEEKANNCLMTIAKVLSNATNRGGEFISRFDDDTFGLILPNVQTDGAIAFASKLSDLVRKANIDHELTTVYNTKNLSISVGITEFKKADIIDVDDIIKQSLHALQAAKNLGGDSTQVYVSDAQKNSASRPIPMRPKLVKNRIRVA
jgi:diguanylate cyclase (GGDEF)-like protein